MENIEITKFNLEDMVRIIKFIGKSYKEGVKEYNITNALLLANHKYNISIKEEDGYGSAYNYNNIICEITSNDNRKLTIEIIPKSYYQEEYWNIFFIKYSSTDKKDKNEFIFGSIYGGWNYDCLSTLKTQDLLKNYSFSYRTRLDDSVEGRLTPNQTLNQAVFGNYSYVLLNHDFSLRNGQCNADIEAIKEVFSNYIFSDYELALILNTLKEEKALITGVNTLVDCLNDEQKEQLANVVDSPKFQQVLSKKIKTRK